MTKLLNTRLGFGPALLNAGANVYHAPDTGIGGAMSENPSTGESLSMEMVWRHGTLTQSSHDGWGPMGIVAYGRKPGPGEVDDTKRFKAEPKRKRMRLKKYRTLLYGGIYSPEDFLSAKELIMKTSPMGRAIFEAYDRFLEEEERKDSLDRNFEFIFPGDGTYAARTADQNRVTSWGSAISIEAGESIFALLHEIVHAMPLDRLPAELLRIPYRSPEQEGLSFEDRFVRGIESAYHDEAISGLSEVILFDDFCQADAPLPKDGENGYVDHVRAMHDVYMNEGIGAYLDSELYIGRNHRIDYNVNRLTQIAFVTLADPEILKDVTISSVLAEGGIQVTAPDGSKAAELIAAAGEVQSNPTWENLQALAVHAPRMLQYVSFDSRIMVARVKEFFEAYSKGKNPRRGRGFLGKRNVTVGALRLLGKARSVYNDYVQQSMRRAKSPVVGKDVGTSKAQADKDEQEMTAAGLNDEEKDIQRRISFRDGYTEEDFDALSHEEEGVFHSGNEKLEKYRIRQAESEWDAAGLTELQKEIQRQYMKGGLGAVGSMTDEERAEYYAGDKKLIAYRERNKAKAKAAAQKKRSEDDAEAAASMDEELERKLTTAGLTDEEKRGCRVWLESGSTGDILDESDYAAYMKGMEKMDAYDRRLIEKVKAAADDTSNAELEVKMTAAGLSDLEKRAHRMHLIRASIEDEQDFMSVDEEKAEISGFKKIEEYERGLKEQSEAKAKAAAKWEAGSEDEKLAWLIKDGTLTEEEANLYKEFKQKGMSRDELSKLADGGDAHAHAVRDAVRKVEKEKRIFEESVRANYVDQAIVEAGLTDEERDFFWERVEDRYELEKRADAGDVMAKKQLSILNRVEVAEKRIAKREAEAEAKAEQEAEGEKSFEERLYEQAELTDEDVALYKEYQDGNATVEELSDRYAKGDESAGRMLNVVERVNDVEPHVKATVEVNMKGKAFMDEYETALNAVGIDRGSDKARAVCSYMTDAEDRAEVQQESRDGDPKAKKLIELVARVEAAKKRLDKKAAMSEAASEYDFQPNADDGANALDALWNMTLDLAQEAQGARREDLIARATFLKGRIEKMPDSGELSGIPTYDDLLERYGVAVGDVNALQGSKLAWDRVRDLHAAVILRDKKETTIVLEKIVSEIEGVLKRWREEEEGETEDLVAIGIEVPGIMAAVGRIMRTAWKFGLPVKKVYTKQLGTVARAMHDFLRSKNLKEKDLGSVGKGILLSEVFGPRAQADYVSFFFDLLNTPDTKMLARDWARFFLGSPMGLFFYRHLNKSYEQAARAWKKDYDAKGVKRAFEGHGFYHFFFPNTDLAYKAGTYSEGLGANLKGHIGYGSFGDLLKHSDKVRAGSLGNVSIRHRHPTDLNQEWNTLTVPVSSLPIEPSRVEGAVAYRGKDGAPRIDIALHGLYSSLFRAWGLLTALPFFDEEAREEMLGEVGNILEETPYDSGDRTLFASLRMYFAQVLAVHGNFEAADRETMRMDELSQEAARLMPGDFKDDPGIGRDFAFAYENALTSDMSSLVKARIALAAHEGGDHAEARKRVDRLHDYYKSIIHLRREGVYPDGMARAAEALSEYPEYRDVAQDILSLAIEHVDVFKNDEENFPRALEWIIRSIDGAALPYDLREALMSDLVRTVVPEVRETAGYSPQEMQLKAYHVARVNDVIYERGLSVHLSRYEGAEGLLYNRTADLIDEYGSMATSDATMRGRFLQAAMRVNREIAFTRPQLIAEKNIEKFERMDDDASFQLDLADIFPAQLGAFDPDSPVDEWNPTYVRRGLPEPEQAFEKIKEALNALSETRLVIARSAATKQSRSDSLKNRDRHVGLQPPRDDNLTKEGSYQQTLDVYSAFVRWEVDRAAASKPHSLKAFDNIVEAYKKRVKERGRMNGIGDVTGLTKDDLHLVPTMAVGLGNMLSRRELMNLRETLSLSSVAFAFDRLGSALGERTDLSESDESIVMAALDARGPNEAHAKRELYLYTLIHDSATLPLKRRAAYNLALSFSQEETIARMIDAYEKTGDAEAEARFYQRITGFWELTGQLPSDYYLMLLDAAGNGTGDPLERLGDLMRSNGTQPTVLDLELRYGWQRYYGRFIEDCQACIDSGFRVPASVVHRDQVAQFIVPLKDDPERARALVRDLRVRHQNRNEEIEIAKANLPNIFLKQPPVVRFLLLSYFGELKGFERTRLVQEMNELERAEGRAQTFMHFFQMAGLEKLGQMLSTMVGIVPDADRKVFARLQDKVPAGSAAEVRETIEREQGASIDEIYSEFDDTPIASASIAEVNRARMKETGEEVYIKEIPGSKRRRVVGTAARLRKVAENFAGHSDRFAMGLDIAGMLNWFADQLEKQLDLRREMRNAVNFAGRHDALTPSYITATKSVLVMSPLDGIKVTDLDASSPHRTKAARQIARTGIGAVLAGYYHADPHPGNIFVNETNGNVSWLDFGTMGELDVPQRKQIMDFLFTLAMDDVHAQRMAVEAMAEPDASYDGDAFEEALAGLSDMELTERAARIIALAGENHLFVQYRCSQAITNLLTLRGVVQQLDPKFDFVSVVSEVMPSEYDDAQRRIDGARSAAAEERRAHDSWDETAGLDSLLPKEKAKSTTHARAKALYGLIEQHMDELEDAMGEDDFADLDEFADELVERAESAPDAPVVKRQLQKVEDTLRKHLGDDVVDAVLED